MTGADDLADVERVLAGDPSAFAGIVRRWQRPLVNLAYRFCRDRGRAEDLAQEAFLRAYRGLGQWRRQGMFSTWLFALATNLYRSEIRRIPPAPLPLADFDAPDTGHAPHDDDDDLHRVVRRTVETLPPKYREALIVFYFQEMDVAAAAAVLGVPEGTLKARLSRARALLRRKLPAAAAAGGPMKDELDRALSNEPDIDPSPAFVRTVMAAVEREAAGPPPLPFPWLRAAPIGVAALGVVVVGVYAALSAPPPAGPSPDPLLLRFAATPVAISIAIALLASAASVAVAAVRMER